MTVSCCTTPHKCSSCPTTRTSTLCSSSGTALSALTRRRCARITISVQKSKITRTFVVYGARTRCLYAISSPRKIKSRAHSIVQEFDMKDASLKTVSGLWHSLRYAAFSLGYSDGTDILVCACVHDHWLAIDIRAGRTIRRCRFHLHAVCQFG